MMSHLAMILPLLVIKTLNVGSGLFTNDTAGFEFSILWLKGKMQV